jgi:ABC-type lipoprotein release transport system permease subunit
MRVAEAELLRPQADAAGLPALLLSERRAAVEGLVPGARVHITCSRLYEAQAQSVNIVTQELVLQGAFAAKFVLFDANTALVHIDTMRALLASGRDDACNVVVLKLKDPRQDRATAARLERALNEALLSGWQRGITVQDWEATNSQFLSAVDHQRSLMKLVLFAIMVVAAFLMFATLSMMVTEKVHDIGILSALGATRLGVLQVFLSCGVAIAVAGTVLGIIAGCLSAIYLDDFNQWLRATFDVDLFPTTVYNLRRVPYHLDPVWIAQVAAMALGVGVLVSGVPAWRASRHDPVTSLRSE